MPIVKAGRWDINYIQEGSGPDVVLIHGLAGDYNAWKPQVSVLKATYRVAAFDNPGSGKSGNVPAGSTVRDLGECTLRLMDALGIESAQVVGRSMGGAIGHQMALMAPKRVRSPRTRTIAVWFEGVICQATRRRPRRSRRTRSPGRSRPRPKASCCGRRSRRCRPPSAPRNSRPGRSERRTPAP